MRLVGAGWVGAESFSLARALHLFDEVQRQRSEDMKTDALLTRGAVWGKK